MKLFLSLLTFVSSIATSAHAVPEALTGTIWRSDYRRDIGTLEVQFLQNLEVIFRHDKGACAFNEDGTIKTCVPNVVYQQKYSLRNLPSSHPKTTVWGFRNEQMGISINADDVANEKPSVRYLFYSNRIYSQIWESTRLYKVNIGPKR